MPVTTPAPQPGLVLTSSHYGDVLVGGPGPDTLAAGVGPDQLTGGAGPDLFVFGTRPWNGAEITDFQPGIDRLDISALYEGGYHGADPVADGYVTFVSDGAGGTKVMLDADGPGTAHTWSSLVAVLDHVDPRSLAAASVFGGAALPGGLTLISSRYGDVLVGSAGPDTLVGGLGPDKLTGGAGADVFVYHARPWNGGEITDFQPGVDRLDISALYEGGYRGADPLADGYVTFEADGAGNTKVMLDADGPGAAHTWSSLVTILDGLSPSSLTAALVFGSPQPQPVSASAVSAASVAAPPIGNANGAAYSFEESSLAHLMTSHSMGAHAYADPWVFA